MPCKLLETEATPKKAICTSPSFGRLIPDFKTMSEALVTHLSRTAEKLRNQSSAAGTMTVFVHTNRFKRSSNGQLARQYYNSRTMQLPHPTASTSELAGYALAALKSVYQFGYDYQGPALTPPGTTSSSGCRLLTPRSGGRYWGFAESCSSENRCFAVGVGDIVGYSYLYTGLSA